MLLKINWSFNEKTVDNGGRVANWLMWIIPVWRCDVTCNKLVQCICLHCCRMLSRKGCQQMSHWKLINVVNVLKISSNACCWNKNTSSKNCSSNYSLFIYFLFMKFAHCQFAYVSVNRFLPLSFLPEVLNPISTKLSHAIQVCV